LPHRGYGTMRRCPNCRVANRKVENTRALHSDKGRFTTGRWSARVRGFTWELTLEEHAAAIQGGVCEYCSNPLAPSGAGLGRKDNTLGYTADNVVPCCWPCKFLRSRGAFTYEEMLGLGVLLGPIWRAHPPMGTGGRPDRTKKVAS
jgi:hypothetical protein